MINSMLRLKRLEETFEQKHPTGQTKLIFQNVDETESEALERAGISELYDNDLNIFIIKWCSATPDGPHHLPGTAQATEPEPETIESVNEELESLKAQLQKDEIVKTEPAISIKNDTDKPEEETEKDKFLKVEPMSDSFLTGMNR